jgi:hypothetical protein
MAFGGASFALTAVVGLASSVTIARLYGASTLGELALAQAPALALAFLSTAQEQAASCAGSRSCTRARRA